MQTIPVKKFEKLSTELNANGQAVVTKITDFRQGVVHFEVACGGEKKVFQSLKEVRDYLESIPKNRSQATVHANRWSRTGESSVL